MTSAFQATFALIFVLKEASAINFCDLATSSSDPRAEHIAVREWLDEPQGKCYFAIKPESIKQFSTCPHDQRSSRKFSVDLELGRKICNNYEATLPMIKSKEEIDAIQRFRAQDWEEAVVPLGMSWGQDTAKNKIIIEWDDGTIAIYDDSSTYVPNWTREGHAFTAIYLKTGGWSSSEWPHSIRMIILVCQQDLSGPHVLIKEPSTLPLNDLPPVDLGLPEADVGSLSDFCDYSVENSDTRISDVAASFYSYAPNGTVEKCFFILKRRDWPINKCVGSVIPHLIMDTEQAKKICQAYSGTLPMIKNIEQWNALGAFSYVMPWVGWPLLLNIPLGIKSQSAEKKTIVWEDGTIYTFNTTHPFDNKVEWTETNGTQLFLRMFVFYIGLKSRSVDPYSRSVSPSEILVCEQDMSRFPTKQPSIANTYPPDVNFDHRTESIDNVTDFCDRAQVSGDPRNEWIQNRVYYRDKNDGDAPQEKCFFSVKVNLNLNGFDIDHCRSICKKFSATLPMIRDIKEHVKLVGLGKSMMGLDADHYVPLGMKKWSYFDIPRWRETNWTRIYWDDGSVTEARNGSRLFGDRRPARFDWHAWNDHHMDGVNVTLFSGKNWRWWSKRSNEVDKPIVLICEQDFEQRAPYTTTEEPTTISPVTTQHATTVRMDTTTNSITNRATIPPSSKSRPKLIVSRCLTTVGVIAGITVGGNLRF